MLIKFDIPRSEVNLVAASVKKEADYIKTGISPLVDYTDSYKANCACAKRGEFTKSAFDFEKPFTVWQTKRVNRAYAQRI